MYPGESASACCAVDIQHRSHSSCAKLCCTCCSNRHLAAQLGRGYMHIYIELQRNLAGTRKSPLLASMSHVLPAVSFGVFMAAYPHDR